MSPLELAARALYEDNVERNSIVPLAASRFGGFTDTWERLHPDSQDGYRRQARAVLQALQGQGDAMASARSNLLAMERGLKLTRFDLSDAWRAMIDAALEEAS